MKPALVLAGIALIAAALALPGPSETPAAPVSAGMVTMGHEMFAPGIVTIHAGERLTFANSSAWLHVIVPGRGARQNSQPGMPRLGSRDAHVIEHGQTWTTPAWRVPGTYFLTCQLHLEMTLEVRVLGTQHRNG